MTRTEPCSVEFSQRPDVAASWKDGATADDEADDEEFTNMRPPTPEQPRRRKMAQNEANGACPADLSASDQLPTKREVWIFFGLFFLIALVGLHFIIGTLTQEGKPWRWGCRQCKKEWWRDFWRWRLELAHSPANVDGANVELNRQPPPPGMDWNWGASTNTTDWWVASDELINEVVVPHVDTSLGPVLQIGCGDSPFPALLYRAGFQNSEHIDIEPRVVETMQERYPQSQWPGLTFEVRDFLETGEFFAGPPPPLHRFAAVVDKAGIWDWLVEEKPSLLPRLLVAVSDALVLMPRPGVYVVATKQKPSDFQQSLIKYGSNSFVVDATRPLLSSNNVGATAWAYVLIPV